jgi:LAO/AO transport system kinase
MKAGILEIADVLCVNKADRPGADRAVQDLEQMLALRALGAARPPIVRTVAVSGEGIGELASRLDECLGEPRGERQQGRLLRRARTQIEDLLRERATAALVARLGERLDGLVAQVARRELDPYTLVEQLIEPLRGP